MTKRTRTKSRSLRRLTADPLPIQPPRKSPSGRSASPNTLEIDFLILGVESDDDVRNRMASDLLALTHRVPVQHAHLSLERQDAEEMPFQAAVMLVVPGPDIHVTDCDHTWLAAWRKVLERLREEIEQWRGRQAQRKKRQPRRQRPAASRASEG